MLPRIIRVWAWVGVCLLLGCSVAGLMAQQPQAPAQQSAAVAEPEAPRVVLQAETTASVLRLMKFSGALRDRTGNARTGAVGLTFALYKEQQGGSQLWLEVQNAQLDEQGRYTVLLGSTKSEGLPLEVFSSGEARWLGVQLNLPGEEEQARVLLVSVPYALKAADAEMLGGKPLSAFLLAEKEGREAAGTTPEGGKEAIKTGPERPGVFGPISGDGTADSLARFTSANTIANSTIVDVLGKVGIGTATPNVKLSLGTDLLAQKLALYDGLGDFYGLGVQPGRVVLHTANSERMAITSGGNVGIGTAAPGARLAVTGAGTGDARFGDPGCGGNYTGIWLNQLAADCSSYNLTSSPGDQTLYVNRPAGAGIEFREGNAAQMVVRPGGKVGIGTTAPNVNLSLGTDITAQKLALYDGPGDFYGLGVQGGRLVFHTGNAEKMAITTAGMVGIGTATPGGLLSLHSAGANLIRMTNSAANQANSGTLDFLEIDGVLGTNTAGFRLKYDGVVNRFQVKSSDQFGPIIEPMSIGRSSGDVTFGFDVGIGTTVPAARLHVQGSQPPSSTGVGTPAADGLAVTGGKGGNTTGIGFLAGKGADMYLFAGPGGNAPAGSQNGVGGDVTINPGVTGNGPGAAGPAGNIRMATLPTMKVGIGTTTPTARLHVVGWQPPANAGNGTPANDTLNVVGGTGGNTTVGGGFIAGRGADIILTAGQGGAAVVGSTDGNGGDVIINGGLPGIGGFGSALTGDVRLATNSTLSGVVIGVGTPGAKLHVFGNANITGTLVKGGGAFRIDHPLEPANKYLSHSFVESPDMMNIYNGNARLDARGEAWVELPEWFEALNGDFRYQLTAVGAPGPKLYIAVKISRNRFKIAGGQKGGEVSWQVTGVRKDAYANAYRIKVEEDKPPAQRGSYMHPELYAQPAQKNLEAPQQSVRPMADPK